MIRNFHLLNLRSQVPITQVQFLPNFFHSHEIEAIQQMIRSVPDEEGQIMGADQSSNLVFRNSAVKWLPWAEDNWWLFTRIMEKAKDLNDQLWKFDLYGINEFLQYTEYESKPMGRGHYDYHMDLSHHGLASNRKLSFECVLDDHYEGGEFSLLMSPTEEKVTLKKGDAVFYPSFLMSKIYPVRQGKRTSIVGWLSGPAFR